MNYKLIAAVDRNLAIGADNAMPWHLPDDFAHFKATTMGGVILMGRKTAQSLGRALKGRDNLVLTRSKTVPFAGMHAVGSFDEAQQWAQKDGHDTIWVIGGGEIYRQTMDIADELIVTHVGVTLDYADTYFPKIGDQWYDSEHRFVPKGNGNQHPFDIVVYKKR